MSWVDQLAIETKSNSHSPHKNLHQRIHSWVKTRETELIVSYFVNCNSPAVLSSWLACMELVSEGYMFGCGPSKIMPWAAPYLGGHHHFSSDLPTSWAWLWYTELTAGKTRCIHNSIILPSVPRSVDFSATTAKPICMEIQGWTCWLSGDFICWLHLDLVKSKCNS